MRYFLLGFLAGLIVFAALNVLAAHLRSDCGLPAILGTSHCADDIRRAGFPFIFYEDGGFAYHHNFSPATLLVDLALGLAVSVAAGGAALRFLRRP